MFFFFQAEDGIRDLVRSRGLGDVYKRQVDQLIGQVFEDKVLERKPGVARLDQRAPSQRVQRLSLIHI